jgi:hypothetical protein
MASNQRYFKRHPLLIDSSKLRFAEASPTFNLDAYNNAARADKRAALALALRIHEVNQLLEQNQKYLAIDSKRKKPSVELLPINKIRKLLQRSPNAPNTLPALSLAAA